MEEIDVTSDQRIMRQHKNKNTAGYRSADVYSVKRARPLARRLFNTLRPSLDALRARKPCVFARWRVCGW